MTREEAIKELEFAKFTDDYVLHEALDIAIKSLKQESCEDAIRRQAGLDKEVYTETEEGWSGRTVDVKVIEALPSVKPQEKTGRWIKYGSPRCGEQHYQCTACGYYINFGQWGELYTKEFKYCPNCYARMIELKEGDDQE